MKVYPELQPGALVTINGCGDLMMNRAEGKFIGEDCIVVKKTKSGRFQVALEADPKVNISVSSENISPRNMAVSR